MRVVGIDEVGRGCWAGPLVAAAVILKQPIASLKDSKKLSKLQREHLAEQIQKQAVAIGVGWVWAEAIDSDGISAAVKSAMEQALADVTVPYDKIVVDGNINYLAHDPRSVAIIKADDSVPAVSAASIIAKVARDTYMATIAAEYPGYGFEQHVGYGTALHSTKLKELGVCNIHRLSYKPIKALLA